MSCTHCPNRNLRHAFTLIELLVVIAIIAVLVGLLLNAVQSVRQAANRAACSNNLKQIGLAIHHYHDANRRLPPGGVTEGVCCSTKSGATWTIYLLPYLEQDNLYKRYDFTKPNEDTDPKSDNAFVRTSFVKVYTCPSDIDTDKVSIPESGPGGDLKLEYMPGSYRAVSGKSNADWYWDNADPVANANAADKEVYHGWRGALHWTAKKYSVGSERFASITDGMSNTLMVGEYTTRTHINRRTFWAYTYTSYNQSSATPPQSRTLLPDLELCKSIGGAGDWNTCKRAWGSFHTGGSNFVMCDGSVRFVSQNIDMVLFGNLCTIAGGEVTQDF